MIAAGRPIIFATSIARERPGMPVIMRYVGCPVAEQITAEGTATRQCRADYADGSSVTSPVVTIKIDKTAPVVTFCQPKCWASWNVGKRLVQVAPE